MQTSISQFSNAQLDKESTFAEACRADGQDEAKWADQLLAEQIRRAAAKHHRVAYNGACVAIDYVSTPKMEFHIACMRILDNGANGYVLTPKAEIFAVQQGKRSARRVRDAAEQQTAIALFN